MKIILGFLGFAIWLFQIATIVPRVFASNAIDGFNVFVAFSLVASMCLLMAVDGLRERRS